MERIASIDPNDLLVFAYIVEAGSFTRAAEQLGLPKSTVSRRLSLLEERLGERLLLRTTRKLTLTDFGHGIIGHARQIASEVDAANALADHRRARPTGRLRVSMPHDFAITILHEVLARYVERYPEVALDIDLSPRRVDLVGEFSQGLFASPDYLVQHPRIAAPEDLTEREALCLVGRDGQPRPWDLCDGQRHVQIDPRARITANSPDVLIGLACAGSGITLVPTHYASEGMHAGRLARVLPQWSSPGGKGWAVFPGRRLMPARTRAFLDLLDELPIADKSRAT